MSYNQFVLFTKMIILFHQVDSDCDYTQNEKVARYEVSIAQKFENIKPFLLSSCIPQGLFIDLS